MFKHYLDMRRFDCAKSFSTNAYPLSGKPSIFFAALVSPLRFNRWKGYCICIHMYVCMCIYVHVYIIYIYAGFPVKLRGSAEPKARLIPSRRQRMPTPGERFSAQTTPVAAPRSAPVSQSFEPPCRTRLRPSTPPKAGRWETRRSGGMCSSGLPPAPQPPYHRSSILSIPSNLLVWIGDGIKDLEIWTFLS